MTSEHTQEQTYEFFKKNMFFGLNSSDIVFFEQNTLPCMTFDGKIILETPTKISRAPGMIYCLIKYTMKKYITFS